MELEIEERGDAGYEWFISNKEKINADGIMKFMEDDEVMEKPEGKGEVGENEYENFYFKALRVGAQGLDFILKRPWEKNVISKIFRVDV